MTAAKRLLLAAASCWAALPAWADEPPETPAASASEPEPGASAPPAPTPPPPPPDTELDLLYLGPGALGDGWTSINVIVSLFAYFERNAGTTWVSSSGVGVLTDERRLLFTEDLADGPALTRFLTDPGELSAEVVEDALPVLDSPFEVNFQVPWQGHFDWVGKALDESTGGDFPDVRQVTGRLIRLENQRGEAVLSLELPGAAGHPVGTEVLDYSRQFGAASVVKTPDDEVRFYSLGKAMGHAARSVAELRRLREEGGDRPQLVLLHGGLADRRPEAGELAGELAAALRPHAVVPRPAELKLGADGLTEFARRHGLPFVAANLRRAGDEKGTLLPRFVVRRHGGLVTVVVGLVGSDALAGLPAPLAAGFSVEDPGPALVRVRKDLRDQLGRRPDLLVVLTSATGADLQQLRQARSVDLVVGEAARYDTMALREVVEVSDAGTGRELTRYPRPLLAPRAVHAAVGRVRTTFRPPEEPSASPRLVRLAHEVRPLFEAGERDDGVFHKVRALEERWVETESAVALPDVAPIVDRHPELHPLVWGDRVLARGGYRRYSRLLPARYSDPLWMRLATELLRRELGAEVALSRNLPRLSDMLGPLTRWFLVEWLRAADAVQVVELDGAALRKVLRHLARQADGEVEPGHFVFAAGLDAHRGTVGGRPLSDRERYQVVITDYLARIPELAEVLQGREPATRFTPTDDGWRADAEGAPLLVRDVIHTAVDRWADPATGSFDPARTAEVEALLTRDAEVRSRWVLRVDELSLSANSFANAGAAGTSGPFEETRETRLTMPDNHSLGGGVDLALLYEGPAVTWENRLRGRLMRAVITLDSGQEVAQEQADDVLAFSELRLDSVRLDVAGDAFRLVPYLRGAWDSELTGRPTPEDVWQPPEQHLLRAGLGGVAYPGPRLREVRLGGLAQRDVPRARNDFGLELGWRLTLPLGPLQATNDLDLRYLVPDADDGVEDLALVLASRTQLLVPVTDWLSFMVFADLYLARGKVKETRRQSGSYILGGGLQVGRVFKL